MVDETMTNEIIKIEGLTKRYGGFTAVDDLTLGVNRGEVFGLLGPNGAGKTTTTLMLLGLTEPTRGRARIGGIDCTRDPLRVKRFVGYLPDNMGFYPDMTGRENLRLTGRMNGLDGAALEDRIQLLLQRVGMTEAADRRAGTYSKGMKQRLGVADILIKDPEVLIMDEPTNGIDPEGMRELMRLIRELAREDGKTILISSHQLHQIQQICDRVGIFVHGRLIACGRIEELAQQLEQDGGYCYEVGARPGGAELLTCLQGVEGVDSVTLERELAVVKAGSDVCAEITRKLAASGFELYHLRKRDVDLDDIYSRYFEREGEERGSGNKGERSRIGKLVR